MSDNIGPAWALSAVPARRVRRHPETAGAGMDVTGRLLGSGWLDLASLMIYGYPLARRAGLR